MIGSEWREWKSDKNARTLTMTNYNELTKGNGMNTFSKKDTFSDSSMCFIHCTTRKSIKHQRIKQQQEEDKKIQLFYMNIILST